MKPHSSRPRWLGILAALFLCSVSIAAPGDERPHPDEVKDFVADPVSTAPSDYFKDFKITQKDFADILKDYFQVEEDQWKHGYSHVAFGDRTGHVILKDGRKINWMVRPGGLAVLELPGGKKIHLAASKPKTHTRP